MDVSLCEDGSLEILLHVLAGGHAVVLTHTHMMELVSGPARVRELKRISDKENWSSALMACRPLCHCNHCSHGPFVMRCLLQKQPSPSTFSSVHDLIAAGEEKRSSAKEPVITAYLTAH